MFVGGYLTTINQEDFRNEKNCFVIYVKFCFDDLPGHGRGNQRSSFMVSESS